MPKCEPNEYKNINHRQHKIKKVDYLSSIYGIYYFPIET